MRTKYLSADELAYRYSVSRNTIWRWARENNLPQPLKLGGKCIRWKEEDIDLYEKTLMEKQESRSPS